MFSKEAFPAGEPRDQATVDEQALALALDKRATHPVVRLGQRELHFAPALLQPVQLLQLLGDYGEVCNCEIFSQFIYFL
jgi:hypothetical protein